MSSIRFNSLLSMRLICARSTIGSIRRSSSRSPSSSVWLQRQQNDPFVRQRQTSQSFVSRSAFKLLELHDKLDLIKPGTSIVDLGAAPGGWIQAADEVLRGTGTIVGVDLLPLKLSKIAANTQRIGFVKGDFLEPRTQANLRKTLMKITGQADPQVDLVLSDMMANTSGSSLRDSALSLTLCESALSFALQHLSPAPPSSSRTQLVVKHFTSHHTKEFTERLKKYFEVVRWIKPESSRKESREGFLVCGGLRPREEWPVEEARADTSRKETKGAGAEEDSLYF
ncbi:21S rRNA (uridine2791-2'-O) methyltransferase [Sporobolomyces salmoneus]|uniref:21S rRNA (uridine2791-2'-O) methyltransferase n=1 Tax=Sporobolomyces salmoneus TaxID=183962 RepID=UPI0031737084